MSYGNDLRVCRFCGKEIFQKGNGEWTLNEAGSLPTSLVFDTGTTCEESGSNPFGRHGHEPAEAWS
jgi:hypothetical protein